MNTQPRAFIFLAEGFEITEAMAPADILIRGGIELNIISIGSSHAVTSAQRISVNAESTLDEYPLNDIRKEDIMIFPGGMPGTSNLAECAPLMNRMQRHFAEGGTVAKGSNGHRPASGCSRGRQHHHRQRPRPRHSVRA